MSARARRNAAGFTLVEALVALVLMGLVLTGLAMATGQLMPQWARGLSRIEASERLALALDRVTADLAAAEFVPAHTAAKGPLFEGSATRITFARTALGPNAPPGIEIVRLAPANDLSGAGLARSTAPLLPRGPEAPPPALGTPVELLGPAWRISFSFAGRDGIWRTDWASAEDLPRAVRIVVREASGGRALPFSTTAIIRTELPAACVTEKTRRGCDKPPAFNTSAATAAGSVH